MFVFMLAPWCVANGFNIAPEAFGYPDAAGAWCGGMPRIGWMRLPAGWHLPAFHGIITGVWPCWHTPPLQVDHAMPRMRSRGYVMVVPNRVVTVTIPMAGVS